MTQKKTSKFLGIVQFFNHFNYFKLLLITLLFQIHFKEDCTSLCTSLCSPHVQLIDDDFIPFFSVFFLQFFHKKGFLGDSTAWKVSVFGVILVRIFRMWEKCEFSTNAEKCGHFLLSVLLYFGNFLCKLSTSLAITVKILSKLLPVRNSIVNGLVVNVFCKTFHLKYLTEIWIGLWDPLHL